MAKSLIDMIWKPLEDYRGHRIWIALVYMPLYAVRIGAHGVLASLELKQIREYVDDYWKMKVN